MIIKFTGKPPFDHGSHGRYATGIQFLTLFEEHRETGDSCSSCLPGQVNPMSYLVSLGFSACGWGLAVSALFFFKAQPQPQVLFCSAIIITSFLIKHLINNLTILEKKRRPSYFGFNSLILWRTVSNSFWRSCSYCSRVCNGVSRRSFSCHRPVPRQPQLQTSDSRRRYFSRVSGLMAYGIQYPWRSLRTKPACLRTLRCCEAAAALIPDCLAISLAPKGPWVFKSSRIFTRVSTARTLNISEISISMHD